VEKRTFVLDVSGKSKPFFQKRYGRMFPVQGMCPDALVQSWDEALRKILKDFEADLRGPVLKTERG
jgi:hypothetical protein